MTETATADPLNIAGLCDAIRAGTLPVKDFNAIVAALAKVGRSPSAERRTPGDDGAPKDEHGEPIFAMRSRASAPWYDTMHFESEVRGHDAASLTIAAPEAPSDAREARLKTVAQDIIAREMRARPDDPGRADEIARRVREWGELSAANHTSFNDPESYVRICLERRDLERGAVL